VVGGLVAGLQLNRPIGKLSQFILSFKRDILAKSATKTAFVTPRLAI